MSGRLKVINPDRMADGANETGSCGKLAAGLRTATLLRFITSQRTRQFFMAWSSLRPIAEACVARSGPMPLRAALRIAWQVSKALAAAAKQQLVHRDIKPANIMIVADSEEEDWPSVKLIDFGLVRSVLRAHGSTSATRSGFVGTAQFASPEQIEEREVDARSDIYSLGCTLWYLLTGEAPFTGSLASVFAQHLGTEPPWGKLRPFPKRISSLLRRMLRKEPSQRPTSAVELRREIEQCLNDVERREDLAARIALPFNIGRQWLIAAPWSRGAVICSVSGSAACCSPLAIMGTMAFLHGRHLRCKPAVRAHRTLPPRTIGLPRRSLAGPISVTGMNLLVRGFGAPRSFAETASPHPAVVGANRWLPEDSIWNAEVAEPFTVKNDSRSGKENPFSTAITLEDSFSVGARENEKVALQDKDEVKKTTKYSVKKRQRRVTSRDRDGEFSPLQELQRVRKNIKRMISSIL
jgi:hypothetical protein